MNFFLAVTFIFFISASDPLLLFDFLNSCPCPHEILTRTNLCEGSFYCCGSSCYHAIIKSTHRVDLGWEFDDRDLALFLASAPHVSSVY